ncbi:SusD family protein [Arachidicoccus rhizosphaerae]|uniref:SusD family protein n=1 Tax=Arachidicoccus rhizosphaerae TaxID=551991 RepID=A0A1H4AIJ8_9BACT|nr:RagB/SusD family nutrient uptake outer membrane protein [Arachidicoccus rhizosphaerae]SEA35839.1 SusD family protein [Arachidicoccus rhizosphaerae]
MRKKILNKTLIYTLIGSAMAFICLASSCNLDEYNPTAGDATETSFNTWSGLLVQCYTPLYDQLFSASDFLYVSETGTDLWLSHNDNDNTKELYYYEGLTTSTNGTNKLFTQAYSVISTCNSVINGATALEDGDSATINEMVGEAKCLRGYYYLLLATYYGPVTLNLESAGVATNMTPKRNTIAEIYTQIIKDLTEAASSLGVTPLNGTASRVCKKTALGLLARAYVQGAGEGLSENGTSYWQRAKDVSEELIANASSYNAMLYDNVADLWSHANNRDNKEALFVASGPVSGESDAWNYASKSNKLFSYTYCDPNSLPELVIMKNKQNYFYGRVNNNNFAPSKYLVGCFDASWDSRWENSFTTAFANFSMVQPGWLTYDANVVTLTSTICSKYGIDASHIGEKIYPYADVNATAATYGGNQYVASVWPKGVHSGDINKLEASTNVYVNPYPLQADEDRFAIYLSKDNMSAIEKAARGYAVININDLFASDGRYLSTAAEWTAKTGQVNNGYELYPSLSKFNWSYYGLNYGSNLQVKQGDMFIMRMAEVYLIAAEAEQKLGNGAKAATYLNVLRDRAVRAGAAKHDLTSATEQDVLDEYARELCGEFDRWALLKRHHAFETALPKANPRAAASFNSAIDYYRPISYDFLSQIDNAEQYGDNGYGQTGSSGLNGFLSN